MSKGFLTIAVISGMLLTSVLSGCGAAAKAQPNQAHSHAQPNSDPTADYSFFRQQSNGVISGTPAGMAPGNNAIFVASSTVPDSEVKVLDGGFYESVDLSPDGTMLVFIAHDTDNLSQLYTMNLGNQQIVQLTTGQEDPEAPRFSSDGNTIIFDRVDNSAPGVYQLAMISPNGGSETEITSADLAQLSVYTPVFTPNGSQIVFTGFGAIAAAIYIVNTDGTGLVQLTTGVWTTGIDVYPSVSADGTQIIFARLNETAEPCDGQYTCGWDIYEVGIGGELSGPAATPVTTTEVNSQPRFVSGEIIFISSPDLSSNSYIFRMDPNGSNLTQLTSAPYLEVFTY